MQLFRLKLDVEKDRFVFVIEPDSTVAAERPLKIEGWDQPLILGMTTDGYVREISIPRMGEFLKLLAGEEVAPKGKPGKPGK